MMKAISVRGARTHNLKNVSLDIPRDKLTVITGLSGSGKSSLAFDTLYAEGQRRYVESISAYARQFLELRPRPDVDGIDGLSPSIAIGQRRSSGSSRSVVGTVTEISDYMRLLFARAGVPYCPEHGKHLEMSSIASIVDRTLTLSDGAKIMVLAPVSRGKTGNFKAYFEKSLADGYVRFRIDGVVQVLEVAPSLNDGRPHDVDVVVDRLKVSPEAQRIMLAAELSRPETGRTLYILDEPTTGLHFKDIEQLLGVLRRLTDQGNTVLLIEHNLDVVKCADYVVDMGPDGGENGGVIMAEGTPEEVAESDSVSSPYLKRVL